jgi:signal transduction histidine kinase
LNRAALAEMRTLLLELHPERLMETKIGDLLQQLGDGVLGQTDIDVTLNVEENLELPSEMHVAAYYITQEALNNVVKHAGASQVIVQLHKELQQLILTITDNGRGFDLQQVTATSLGLTNIQERAQSTDAHLDITSEIGKGTRVSVYWSI